MITTILILYSSQVIRFHESSQVAPCYSFQPCTQYHYDSDHVPSIINDSDLTFRTVHKLFLDNSLFLPCTQQPEFTICSLITVISDLILMCLFTFCSLITEHSDLVPMSEFTNCTLITDHSDLVPIPEFTSCSLITVYNDLLPVLDSQFAP